MQIRCNPISIANVSTYSSATNMRHLTQKTADPLKVIISTLKLNPSLASASKPKHLLNYIAELTRCQSRFSFIKSNPTVRFRYLVGLMMSEEMVLPPLHLLRLHAQLGIVLLEPCPDLFLTLGPLRNCQEEIQCCCELLSQFDDIVCLAVCHRCPSVCGRRTAIGSNPSPLLH